MKDGRRRGYSAREYYPEQVKALAGGEWPPVAEVAVSALRVDFSYQRPPTASHIAMFAQNFSRRACGVIHVSRRADGSLWVIDGNHRKEAAARVRVSTLKAFIYDGLAVTEEAALFTLLNSKRKPPSAKAMFHADLTAQEPSAIAIRDVVTGAGLYLDFSCGRGVNAIDCFGALRRVFGDMGAVGLARVLAICTLAWPEDRHSRDGSVIEALSSIVAEFGAKLDDVDFAEKLSQTNVKRLRQIAAGIALETGTYPARALRAAILKQYNSRRRTRLLGGSGR